MELSEVRTRLEAIEDALAGAPFVELLAAERDGRVLHLALTERLHRLARRGRVWASKEMLTALKNASYGFDRQRARSRGGIDGVFLLDRSFTPANEMMRKIFDRYLDKDGSGVAEVAAALGAPAGELVAARLVSHHLRLLGVLWQAADADWLVLVDYDDTR